MKQRQRVMAFNNNNIPTFFYNWVMDVIIVGCHYHFSLLHTAPCFSSHILVPLSALFLGTVIPIYILMNENGSTLVPLLFRCMLLASAGLHEPHPLYCSLIT